MIFHGTGNIYVGDQPITIKENRRKFITSTYDSVIYGLEFQNQPVLELGDMEEISYTASNTDGFEQYGQAQYLEVLPGVSGWVARIYLPNQIGYVRIDWTIKIGGATATVKDKCQVVALN